MLHLTSFDNPADGKNFYILQRSEDRSSSQLVKFNYDKINRGTVGLRDST